MDSQHIKSINTDKRSKKRIRFASAKQRAKNASADVYRNYKRRIGVTSAASREERIHGSDSTRPQKRARSSDDVGGKQSVLGESILDIGSDNDEDLNESNFADELDLALERNGSEIFAKFHREVWHLVRSLPEVLHHAEQVVDTLLAYMLSPESASGEKSPIEVERVKSRESLVVNHATTDILHLLAVLARDLRHEIHKFLHNKIVPRIVDDLLNPPLPPADSNRQLVPLSVTIVEASFRTLAYIFRYDAEVLLSETDTPGVEPCLEPMRRYYGSTIANRRELIRRLAAETFAPLIRRLKSDSSKKRHIRRVLRALTVATANSSSSALGQRLQSDAVDGIAQLLFEVCRGVKGKLHSKGKLIIKFVLDFVSKADEKTSNAAEAVCAELFRRLCEHLKPECAEPLLSIGLATLQNTLDTAGKDVGFCYNRSGLFQILHQITVFREGAILAKSMDAEDELCKLLLKCFDDQIYQSSSGIQKSELVRFLVGTWKARPDAAFANRMKGVIGQICKALPKSMNLLLNCDDGLPISMVIEELLPYLPVNNGMGKLASEVIDATGDMVQDNFELAVSLLQGIASISNQCEQKDSFEALHGEYLVQVEQAKYCCVNQSKREAIFSAAMRELETDNGDDEVLNGIALTVASAKVAAFIFLVETEDRVCTKKSEKLEMLLRAIGRLIRSYIPISSQSEQQVHHVVAVSILLGVFSKLCTPLCKDTRFKMILARTAKELYPTVEELLVKYPHSFYMIQSISLFFEALKQLDVLLRFEPNEMFELLTPNLKAENHWVRMHTLLIMESFPPRPFVMDHNDLDLTGDMDEEPSEIRSTSAPASAGLAGSCNLLSILLEIEMSPVGLSTERKLQALISRVGVLAMTSKLPVVYLEAATSHMLGLLNVKFAPIWGESVKALVCLAKANENIVFPHISKALALKFKKIPKQEPPSQEQDRLATTRFSLDYREVFRCCVRSEILGNTMIVSDGEAELTPGMVPHQCVADEDKVVESLWHVLEKAPHLIMNHSKEFVPIVVEFFEKQYFAAVSNKVDARELGFVLDPITTQCDFDHIDYDKRAILKKTKCVLQAFAALNSPHQLVKHELLLDIFLALVGHQDPVLARLALSCVLRFKRPHMLSCSNELTALLEKHDFNDALTQLSEMVENGRISSDHRNLLVPFLVRLLFGRLSSRGLGGRNTKDSPSARRRRVFSFIASICVTDDELYPCIYLMVRNYIPCHASVKPIEKHRTADRGIVLMHFETMNAATISNLPEPVHQGFLNMLENAMAQFGQRITIYVPAFLRIVLALCCAYRAGANDSAVDPLDPDVSAAGCEFTKHSRRGVIRSLCYQRLSEIISYYSDCIDFSTCASMFWEAVEPGLVYLPEMSASTDNVPALMQLLETLSATRKAYQLLGAKTTAIESLLQCIPVSRIAATTSILNVIENLLGTSHAPNAEGRIVLGQYIGTLLESFRDKFGAFDTSKFSKVPSIKRELNILCEMSSFAQYIDESKVLGDLCSLLVTFVGQDRGITDDDRLHVLKIVSAASSRISRDVAGHLYERLSQLLGPKHSSPGIVSKEIRFELACILERLAEFAPPNKRVAEKVVHLCSIDDKRVDEWNYDKVLPVLNGLSDNSSGDSWIGLCTFEEELEPNCLLPLLQCVFHLLFADDGVVSRAAFKSLKILVAAACARQAGKTALSEQEKWRKLTLSLIVPTTRSGLTTKNDAVRRYYILICREIAIYNAGNECPHFYGDLSILVNEENHDLDFFLGVTHVQLHRRARALQRLRKCICGETDLGLKFTPQSLSNVLLPLSVHPVYECKTNMEESYALEAVATVGSIARYLSWSKYNALLWTALNQFQRQHDQENYLIGMICTVLDNFHFEVVNASDSEDSPGGAVWRALENRIIPKIEGLLVKEKIDRSGTKLKILRPTIVLALLKLFMKFPVHWFQAKLPRLLAVICDGLKNRDSNARDVARSTLAKMSVSMSIRYLPDILRELAVTLKEGYQLHVRTAAMHSILLSLSELYSPTEISSSDDVSDSLDVAVPAFMELVQKDVFGVAQERKSSDGNQVRYVKEAGGSKALNCIELLAKMVQFRPSFAAQQTNHESQVSGVHAIVGPLLERLRSPDCDRKMMSSLKTCLSRAVSGFARNPSLTPQEVLPFVYASLVPFIDEEELNSVTTALVEESSDEDEPLKPINVTGARSSQQPAKEHSATSQVVEWRPSVLDAAVSTRDARNQKEKDQKQHRRVLDGASAPKLTGSGRNRSQNLRVGLGINDPASTAAVSFGLQLFFTSIKRCGSDLHELRNEALDPFVPLLSTCACHSRDTEAMLLSLKCLGFLIRLKLPSLARCAKSLSRKTLDLLTSSGTATSQSEEVLQISYKTLAALMNYDDAEPPLPSEHVLGADGSFGRVTLPLDSEQMQVLISFLQGSITDSKQQGAALHMVKAILSKRHLSAPFYDLMENVLGETVRSPHASTRLTCSTLFLDYFLNYPLSEDRVQQHLKKILLNMKYEYADGRLAAVSLAHKVLSKVPLPVMEAHYQMFFLPLTLQLVNDDNSSCREAVAKCLASLLERLSVEHLRLLFEYTVRWSRGQEAALQRLSMQLFALFVDHRLDFVSRGKCFTELLDQVQRVLNDYRKDKDDDNEWETVYFAVLCLEKVFAQKKSLITVRDDVWIGVMNLLKHSHPWVRLASTRLISSYLGSIDPLEEFPRGSFVQHPGTLHALAKYFCYQLNMEEQGEEITAFVIKSMTWIVDASHAHSALCFEEGDDAHSDPVRWIMSRLATIAKAKSSQRRQVIFKCFAAFASMCSGDFIFDYMELMLEPLHRSDLEAQNEIATTATSFQQMDRAPVVVSEENQLAKDVLQLIEDKCPEHKNFLEAYAAVKKRAQAKKEERKLAVQTEFITDPQKAAKRKIQKQVYEKQRRKRRVEEQKRNGGNAKQRRFK